MQRFSSLLAAFAVIALTVAGCGGGGGGGTDNGGGGGDVPGTTGITVNGRVLGSAGDPIPGATVSFATASAAPKTTVTASDGSYTINNIPVATDMTLTVSRTGITTRSWNAIRLNTTGVTARASVFISIPNTGIPTGAGLGITPSITKIAPGDSQPFAAQVTNAGQPYNTSVVWTAVGNIDARVRSEAPFYGLYLSLSPTAVGEKSRITASAFRTDGTTASTTVLIESTSGDTGTEPPPPPPIGS